MIYRNGTMDLLCITGQKKEKAAFIRISDNELIKAYRVNWNKNNVEVEWEYASYLGSVKNHIKNIEHAQTG